MNATTQPRGKIIIHDRGIGPISRTDVDRRARELALFEGRSAITAEDRAQAERELHGRAVPSTLGENEDATGGASRDPSEPPSDRGHQVPDLEGDDENEAPEDLVLEGADEAQHDQMLADRRRPHREG